jgi:hypothetical protein
MIRDRWNTAVNALLFGTFYAGIVAAWYAVYAYVLGGT